MLKQNFKQSIRVLQKDKFHSFLNIFGLAIGLCCSILVLLFVQNEISYDKHHEKIERIYRYGVNMTIGGVNSTQTTSNIAVGPLLQDEMPEIEEFVRFLNPGNALLEANDKSFYESNMQMTDNSIFNVFTIPFISGNREDALIEPNTIVLTKDMSEKYFGDTNPIGKEMIMENQDIFTVTGVIENMPPNSHLQFDALISMDSFLQNMNIEEVYTPRALGGGMFIRLYFLFAEGFTVEQFQQKFQIFYQNNLAEFDQIQYKAVIEPLKDVYLNSKLNSGFSDANRRFLYGFASLGLFILILACINYVNMATSRAGNRAREIGMKKVLGAQKKQLVSQFLSESVLLAFLGLGLGFFLAELVLKLTPFNTLINKNLEIDLIANPILLVSSIIIALLVGISSGLYPSFFLSQLAPISSLKGEMKKGRKGRFFRNALVSFQFVISIAAVILTLGMQQQIKFLQNMNLGFDKENLLVISSTNPDIQKDFKNFKDMIIKHHGVISAGFSSSSLGYGFTGYAFNWETENGEMEMHATKQLYADMNYLETMGIPIKAGTKFLKERSLDDPSINFIVNQAMVDLFGWTEPIGKSNRYGQVIGVVDNFNFASARDQIEPLYILQPRNTPGVLSVRLKGDNINQTMDFIKDKWQEFSPDIPLNYSFLDENLNRIYVSDEIQRKLSSIFSYFCILISCFGLFGLTSYATTQRTKEVAVRKIMGSSVLRIVHTLSKGIFKIVIISSLLAVPLAYFVFGLWQSNYANKISADPLIFLITLLGAFFISFLTSAYHTIKVANTNPVEALKYE
ncbi:FtsX-like permease family protein [Candidatus Cloacimonadota bacterium]